MNRDFQFAADMWLYSGEAAWHFLTLPVQVAEEIRFFHPKRRGKGWGSVRVDVQIGASRWDTSIFPDKESGSFLLPVKADIRRKEGLSIGRSCQVTLTVVG